MRAIGGVAWASRGNWGWERRAMPAAPQARASARSQVCSIRQRRGAVRWGVARAGGWVEIGAVGAPEAGGRRGRGRIQCIRQKQRGMGWWGVRTVCLQAPSLPHTPTPRARASQALQRRSPSQQCRVRGGPGAAGRIGTELSRALWSMAAGCAQLSSLGPVVQGPVWVASKEQQEGQSSEFNLWRGCSLRGGRGWRRVCRATCGSKGRAAARCARRTRVNPVIRPRVVWGLRAAPCHGGGTALMGAQSRPRGGLALGCGAPACTNVLQHVLAPSWVWCRRGLRAPRGRPRPRRGRPGRWPPRSRGQRRRGPPASP